MAHQKLIKPSSARNSYKLNSNNKATYRDHTGKHKAVGSLQYGSILIVAADWLNLH